MEEIKYKYASVTICWNSGEEENVIVAIGMDEDLENDEDIFYYFSDYEEFLDAINWDLDCNDFRIDCIHDVYEEL